MVQSSLVGWWPLAEWDGGRANDLSGNDNHGTVNGATQGTSGISGLTSYSFNGSSDYIDIGTGVVNSGSPFTVSMWIRTDDNSSLSYAYAQHGSSVSELNIGKSSSNNALVYLQNDSASWIQPEGDSIIRTNTWYHLAVVRGSNTLRIYLNTSLEASESMPGGSYSTNDTDIARRPADADFYWPGEIQDVRVYNRTLSQSEIQHLYEMGSRDLATPPGGADPNAVARYKFDDRSDTTTALDEWGSNDGTINGAVYSADAVRRDSLSMSFDGTDDSIAPTHISNLGTSVTLSAWAKPNSLGSNAQIMQLAANNNTTLRYEFSNNTWHFAVSTDTGSTTIEDGDPSVDAWHHVVGTWDGTDMILYQNGVPVGTAQRGGTMQDANNDDRIGTYHGADANFWDGLIDDVRVYSRALSAHEVNQLYRYGAPGADLRSRTVTR